MIQSIIVYRNPLEAAFWTGGFPNLFPIFCGGVGFILTMILLTKIYDPNFRKNSTLISNLYLVISAIVGIGITWFLWI